MTDVVVYDKNDPMGAFSFPNRQIIGVPGIPDRFGIDLSNEEAQSCISAGWNVRGDDQGPYLIVRVGRGRVLPLTGQRYDVTLFPRPWTYRGRSGITCILITLDQAVKISD